MNPFMGLTIHNPRYRHIISARRSIRIIKPLFDCPWIGTVHYCLEMLIFMLTLMLAGFQVVQFMGHPGPRYAC